MSDPRVRERRRQVVLPALLVLLGLVLTALAVRTGRDDAGGGRAARPAAATPVLSARRVAAWLAAPQADAALQTELADVVAQSPEATCLVVSLGGRVVFSHQGDRPLVPASAHKLVTATAVLEALGADTRLRTRVLAGGELADGTVRGDLVLVGGGDPVLATKEYTDRYEEQPQVRTSIEALADAVVQAGVRRVEGAVVGDESRYDAERYVDIWPDRYTTQNQSGPLSALSVNDGFREWPPVVEPGAPEEVPATDPAAYAAEVLTDLLRQRGVVVVAGARSGRAPDGAAEVAHIDSPPMSDLVGHLLSESDNTSAELLVKEMGLQATGEGSTAAGTRALLEVVERLGLAQPGLAAVDGSGLAEEDQTTCNLLVSVLTRSGPDGAVAEMLPVAGENGTLAERFEDSAARGRLQAKTGTLNTVTALAGFARATQGPVLTFAYVANGRTVTPAFQDLQEVMGEDLVAYPVGPPLAQIGPKPIT